MGEDGRRLATDRLREERRRWGASIHGARPRSRGRPPSATNHAERLQDDGLTAGNETRAEQTIEMPVLFLIPGPLRPFSRGESRVVIEESPPNLAEALEALWKECPGIRDRVVTEQGQIRPHINVFVGNEDVRHTGGLQTRLPDGVTISIIPAISGG